MTISWNRKLRRARPGSRFRKRRIYTPASIIKLDNLRKHVVRCKILASRDPVKLEVIGILDKTIISSKYCIFTPKKMTPISNIDLRTLKKASDEESIIWKLTNEA
jgi:hypothetical protein